MEYIFNQKIMEQFLINIFKIFIFNSNLILNNKKQFNSKIKKIRKQKGRSCSNFSGYQSNDLDCKDKDFSYFIKHIETQANLIAEHIEIKPILKLQNFWLNINSYKDSNREHTHPGSFFSGVYYLKVPKNSGSIYFKNPNANFATFYWKPNHITNFNTVTSTLWKINPTEKQLLIFPSWLEHWVEPNMNKIEERISIAFNVGIKD